MKIPHLPTRKYCFRVDVGFILTIFLYLTADFYAFLRPFNFFIIIKIGKFTLYKMAKEGKI